VNLCVHLSETERWSEGGDKDADQQSDMDRETGSLSEPVRSVQVELQNRRRDALQAAGLQKRYHGLLILSLEWQMRLEEFMNNGLPVGDIRDI